MPRTAIVETATGNIIVLDPPTREDGSVILPEGIESEVVTLTPEQEAFYADLATSGPEATAAEKTAAAALRQQILDLAQSAVGVTLSALTTAQRNALTACLLWKAGGVTNDMKVKALAQWLNGG